MGRAALLVSHHSSELGLASMDSSGSLGPLGTSTGQGEDPAVLGEGKPGHEKDRGHVHSALTPPTTVNLGEPLSWAPPLPSGHDNDHGS